MEVKKARHCAYQTHDHIVFPVKYRKGLLQVKVEKKILEVAHGIGERYEIEFEQIGCDRNHIHVLCSFYPKYSITEVVRKFKSITARELFQEYPEIKRDLWGGEFWSDGYYVETVVERGDWEVVKRYVQKQGSSQDVKQLKLL